MSITPGGKVVPESNVDNSGRINYDNDTSMKSAKTPAKAKQHHVSLYTGYDQKGLARKQKLQQLAKKAGKKPNRFIWACIEKATGVRFTDPTDSLALRSYRSKKSA